MRNSNHTRAEMLPLPFDPLAGLEVIEPRNRMEEDEAMRQYELERLRAGEPT